VRGTPKVKPGFIKPGSKVENAFKIAPGLLGLATMIDTLKPDPNNANEHTPENLAAIKESLQRFGQLKPIVITADRIIRAGNGTWLAAKELGAHVIAAVQIPTEQAHRAEEYALADNQSARLSRWNATKLKEAVDRLRAAGGTPEALGFSTKELQAILAKARPAAAAPADNNWAGATPSKARSKPGDLWALGEHRLLVGDSRDTKAVRRLMGGRKAQLIFTDPPYGVDYEDDKGRKIKNDALGRDGLATFLTAAFKAAVDVASSDAAFYIWHASATRADFEHAMKAAGLEERQYLIWAKPSLVLGRADYQWNHEPCFYASRAGVRPAFYAGRAETTLWRIAAHAGNDTATALGPGVLVSDGAGAELTITAGAGPRKLRHLRVEKGKPLLISDAQGQGTVWEIARDTMQTVHPNQKPVELAVRAIENSTQPGQAVLDLFGGSGSTLMGAEATGRAAFLVELDPRYADAILARWEKATKAKAEKL
jgi:DNA modification methylase